MKQILLYLCMGVLFISILSCDNEIENLKVVKPDNKSEEYWAQLRKYKESDHEVFFGWFGGWTANSADMVNYLSSVPDSVDIISIWGAHGNLNEEQKKDLEYVQKVKGTRVTYTIFAHKIPEEFMEGENHDEVSEKGIRAYAKSLIDTMYKYGYQGIDLDYEPGYAEFPGVPFSGPLVGGNSKWRGSYMDNMEIFVKELGKYIGPKSGTRNLLIIDGVPYHLKDGLAEYFNYGVVQSYRAGSDYSLQNRFNAAAEKGWKPEQYIFAETFEGPRYKNGGVPYTTEDGRRISSLEGMAQFKPMYNGKRAKRKGGCGTYHMETDYRSNPNYKWTRNAIRVMNENK